MYSFFTNLSDTATKYYEQVREAMTGTAPPFGAPVAASSSSSHDTAELSAEGTDPDFMGRCPKGHWQALYGASLYDSLAKQHLTYIKTTLIGVCKTKLPPLDGIKDDTSSDKAISSDDLSGDDAESSSSEDTDSSSKTVPHAAISHYYYKKTNAVRQITIAVNLLWQAINSRLSDEDEKISRASIWALAFKGGFGTNTCKTATYFENQCIDETCQGWIAAVLADQDAKDNSTTLTLRQVFNIFYGYMRKEGVRTSISSARKELIIHESLGWESPSRLFHTHSSSRTPQTRGSFSPEAETHIVLPRVAKDARDPIESLTFP